MLDSVPLRVIDFFGITKISANRRPICTSSSVQCMQLMSWDNLLEVLLLDPAENEITATDTSNISKLFLGVKLQDLKGFQYLSIKPVNELSFR